MTSVKAIICYIEAHIQDEKFDYCDLQKRIGFSQAHIRDLFYKNTGLSLAKYVRMRKVKCSALELINTDKTILEIAYQYGFSNSETYTRAFQKVAGITPGEFRKQRPIVGKGELITGVYSIGKVADAFEKCVKSIKEMKALFVENSGRDGMLKNWQIPKLEKRHVKS